MAGNNTYFKHDGNLYSVPGVTDLNDVIIKIDGYNNLYKNKYEWTEGFSDVGLWPLTRWERFKAWLFNKIVLEATLVTHRDET